MVTDKSKKNLETFLDLSNKPRNEIKQLASEKKNVKQTNTKKPEEPKKEEPVHFFFFSETQEALLIFDFSFLDLQHISKVHSLINFCSNCLVEIKCNFGMSNINWYLKH